MCEILYGSFSKLFNLLLTQTCILRNMVQRRQPTSNEQLL